MLCRHRDQDSSPFVTCLSYPHLMGYWRSDLDAPEHGSHLIATTFPRRANDSIRPGAWKMIDLNAEPFNLPRPLILIDEGLPGLKKSLGVWPLAGLLGYTKA